MWKRTDPRSEYPSSPSSMSEGEPVRGGQERVDTFRARMEPVGERKWGNPNILPEAGNNN